MSDVETAQTGAIAAPVEETAPQQVQTQETPQETAPAETDELQDGQPRDKDGKFASVKKRINELTRQRYEAERRAQELERRLQEVEQQPRHHAPDPNEDWQGYLDHLANERAQEIVQRDRQQSAQQQEQQRLQQIGLQHAAREQVYAQANPDYEEAAATLVSVVGVNPVLAEVLMTSDQGPAVVHYLGTHLDELVQIAQMPPHLAAASIARLEAKVNAPKPKPPVSGAPAPTPSVGGASVAPRGLADDLSVDEWMRRRTQQ